MKQELRCKKCDNCLAKDVEIGAGFFYLDPSRKFVLYKQVIKCLDCKALNEITVEVGVTTNIKLVEQQTATDWIGNLSKNDLYSA